MVLCWDHKHCRWSYCSPPQRPRDHFFNSQCPQELSGGFPPAEGAPPTVPCCLVNKVLSE